MIFRSRTTLITLLGLFLTAMISPFLFSHQADAWGRLDQIDYKIKAGDGNMWEHLTKRGQVIRGKEAPGKVVITFDDGPDHRTTPVILDILDRAKLKAVFFVNCHQFHRASSAGELNKKVLREIYKRGHYIGNHTFGHKDQQTITTEEAWEDVAHCDSMIEGIIGHSPRLYRPPFGRLPDEIRTKLDKRGYTVVMWNLDPEDWRYSDPRFLIKRTMDLIDENPSGGVLLFHDTNRVVTEALEEIIRKIKEKGNTRRRLGKSPLEFSGIESFIQPKQKTAKGSATLTESLRESSLQSLQNTDIRKDNLDSPRLFNNIYGRAYNALKLTEGVPLDRKNAFKQP